MTIATTPTKVVDNNPEAVQLTIINLGAEDVYLRPANNPSTKAGILLLASGGSVSLNVRDDGMLPGRQWYGVSAAATSDMYFLRVARYHVEA